MLLILNVCGALAGLIAGAAMAASGESWWAYALGSLSAFNLATALGNYRWSQRPNIERPTPSLTVDRST